MLSPCNSHHPPRMDATQRTTATANITRKHTPRWQGLQTWGAEVRGANRNERPHEWSPAADLSLKPVASNTMPDSIKFCLRLPWLAPRKRHQTRRYIGHGLIQKAHADARAGDGRSNSKWKQGCAAGTYERVPRTLTETVSPSPQYQQPCCPRIRCCSPFSAALPLR
jgi:hypothetical protein